MGFLHPCPLPPPYFSEKKNLKHLHQMEEIRTKGRGRPEPNRELLAHIWIHLSSTKNLGHPLISFTMGRYRSWGSRLNFLLRILIRTLPGQRSPLEVTSEIPRKGLGRGEEPPRAQDPSSTGEPPPLLGIPISTR